MKTEEDAFPIGTTVMLRSGSMRMTVTGHDQESQKVRVAWRTPDGFIRETFLPQDSVVVVFPAEMSDEEVEDENFVLKTALDVLSKNIDDPSVRDRVMKVVVDDLDV